MSDFKAKMHQIRFWLGLRFRPHWGTYSAYSCVASGKGARCPFPKTQPPTIGPSGLELRPCGPRTTFID